MLRCIFVLLVFLSLVGCKSFSVKDAADGTGVKNQRAGVAMITSSDTTELNNFLKEHIEQSDLKTAIAGSCQEVKPKSVIGVVANVVAASGKLLFERWMEQRSEALEELKQISVRSYSETAIISGSDLKRMSCALVYRYDAKTKDIGFIALLKLTNYEQGVTFTPTFVQASNALAVAKKPKDGSAPAISTSFAIAVKGVGTKQNGLPELDTFGHGVASVGSIYLEDGTNYQCYENCESSDIIPYLPDNNGAVVSVTFSVTEIGDVGFNIDKRIGRIEAIKEALGPAIKSDIDAAFEGE